MTKQTNDNAAADYIQAVKDNLAIQQQVYYELIERQDFARQSLHVATSELAAAAGDLVRGNHGGAIIGIMAAAEKIKKAIARIPPVDDVPFD